MKSAVRLYSKSLLYYVKLGQNFDYIKLIFVFTCRKLLRNVFQNCIAVHYSALKAATILLVFDAPNFCKLKISFVAVFKVR